MKTIGIYDMKSRKTYGSLTDYAFVDAVFDKNKSAIIEHIESARNKRGGRLYEDFAPKEAFWQDYQARLNAIQSREGLPKNTTEKYKQSEKAMESLLNSERFTTAQERGGKNILHHMMDTSAKPIYRDKSGRFRKATEAEMVTDRGNNLFAQFQAETGFTTFKNENRKMKYIGDKKYRWTSPKGIVWIIDFDDSPEFITWYQAGSEKDIVRRAYKENYNDLDIP